MRLSLYQQDSSQSEEFQGSVEVPLNNAYKLYQEELSKRKVEYDSVLKAYYGDRRIGDAWTSMKQSLGQHTQYITRSNSEGTISINLKVVIWSVLDDRV